MVDLTIARCRARAASGQAVAPPSSVMKSRLLICRPQARADHIIGHVQLCITAKFGQQ
jgi:hypothetical protein